MHDGIKTSSRAVPTSTGAAFFCTPDWHWRSVTALMRRLPIDLTTMLAQITMTPVSWQNSTPTTGDLQYIDVAQTFYHDDLGRAWNLFLINPIATDV